MIGIIIRLVLIVVAIFMFLGFGIEKSEERYDREYTFKFKKKCLLSLIPVAFIVLSMCIVFVPSNTVGIRYSAIGGTSEMTLGEGIAFKTPLDKIYYIETTVQERTIQGVTVQTKDSQFVTMEVNVKFKVNEKDAFKVYKGYKTLDALKENIIGNYAQKAIEGISTQYNVIEILGEKKNEIYELASRELEDKLASEGVQLVDIIIKDMDAGEAIEKAIENEAVAKKEVETAKQNQERAEIEAQTKLIEAQGDADANAVKTKQLTKEILMEQWISKWNGVLPTVSDGQGVMIDISKLME